MLTAGVCVCVGWPPGVASTFSAPYGGLLFSVEVTSTYYLIKQLPQSLFADLGGAVVVKVIGLLGTVALFSTNFSAKTQVKRSLHDAAHTPTPRSHATVTSCTFTFHLQNAYSLVMFAILGGFCGLLAAGCNVALTRLIRLRKYLAPRGKHWRQLGGARQ